MRHHCFRIEDMPMSMADMMQFSVNIDFFLSAFVQTMHKSESVPLLITRFALEMLDHLSLPLLVATHQYRLL